ncbi:PIN domain-containing protein [Thermococcus henrietii]|uniref:PIN domain-containing protein n=1 Tax=Thermococcus henrietii TaxID=2016361 RepID=UPI0021D45AD1|nr:PIN domain-containing protein [Thermococcus henrietii]
MTFFGLFRELEINRSIETLAVEYMAKYGILPNDAIILATCKFYGIKYLISFDSDFEEAYEGERIELLKSPEEIPNALEEGK